MQLVCCDSTIVPRLIMWENCRGYVGTQGLKNFGKDSITAGPLIGVGASRARCVSDSVMKGLTCVPLCLGGKRECTLYMYDRNHEMSL